MRPVLPSMIIILAVVIAGCGEDNGAKPTTTSGAQGTTSSSNDTVTPKPAADNTAKNTRDDGSTTTPLDQGMSAADTAITQAVRKAVMADKNMSVNGQNVKIIAKDAAVTLRGPVASQAERELIGEMAQIVHGVRTVDNQLEIVKR